MHGEPTLELLGEHNALDTGRVVCCGGAHRPDGAHAWSELIQWTHPDVYLGMLDDKLVRSLLLRVAARDEESAAAFQRLYRMCAPLLLGVTLRIVGRRELAEEVLQDSFARIWVAAGRFDPTATQPVAWMVAIARNRAIDVRGGHDATRVPLKVEAGIDDTEGMLERYFDWAQGADEAEDQRRAAAWLRDCLRKLQAVERQSLVLAYVQGLSHVELAAHLRKPLGTVKSWVRRGMANLRDCVEMCMGAVR